jgi:glycosyltransferase involved in cell wall biosynthesis
MELFSSPFSFHYLGLIIIIILKKSKKILIIGPFPDPISGVSLANKLVKKVLGESNLFAIDYVNSAYPLFENEIGVFSIKKLIFFLKINFKIFKIFKTDIVYITPGQTFYGILKYAFFILISSALNKELIIHVHGNYLGKQYQELTGFKKKIFHFLVSRFTKGIVLSNSLKQNLIPFIQERSIFCLPNFAQDFLLNTTKKNINNELRIFYLSNLMEEKGILCLLNALINLEKNNVIYKAKIAGNIDQKYSKKILNLLNGLKNTQYIGVVHGYEKKKLLDWGNIFVLPTFYKMEGQPISILEAMATENLVITTDHAGISDIFTDKLNGYFVKKNNVESIQDILYYITFNKNELEKIAMYNKEYFLNNFTENKFKHNLLNILNNNG